MAFRGLTVTGPAKNPLLVSLARLKADLGVTGTGDDAIFRQAIEDASAAVNSFCNRSFERQDYREVGAAYGGIEFVVANAPLVRLSSALLNDGTVTDVSIGDRDQGVLYRRVGFPCSAQSFGWLSAGEDRFLDYGHPISGQEEPQWTLQYRAGYIVPDDDVSSVSISILSSDNSLNSAGGLFPAKLAAGDVVKVTGFNVSSNNGRFVVAGTPTVNKVVFSTDSAALLASDTSTGIKVLTFSNLPADVEKATAITAATFYSARKTPGSSPAVVEKQLGLARVRYGEVSRDSAGTLPPMASGLLRTYRRTLP